MNYHYCQFCYKKTAQGSDIVRFCSHCGKSFSETTASTLQTPNKTSETQKIIQQFSNIDSRTKSSIEAYKRSLANRGLSEVDDGNDNDDDDFDRDDNIKVPNISKLQVDIDIEQNSGTPIRSLASGAQRKPRAETNKPSIKLNKKKFLQEYRKQAAAIKPK